MPDHVIIGTCTADVIVACDVIVAELMSMGNHAQQQKASKVHTIMIFSITCSSQCMIHKISILNNINHNFNMTR